MRLGSHIGILMIAAWILSSCGAQKPVPQSEIPEGPSQYIDQYKRLAIQEMQRTGIPASITLAQGLLESGSGQSELSRKANNHFGIKCKSSWKGRSVRANDDRPNECFRAYSSVEASYRDHSDFLVENPRYASLFELEPDDYRGWAHGLRRAGYATNPRYGNLLITLIERYGLHRYDNGVAGKPVLPDPELTASGEVQAFSFNGLEATMVREEDTYASLSEKWDIHQAVLRRYNDLHETDPLKPGMLLYLQRKYRRSQDAEVHVFKRGETLHYVAQLYGLRLKRLYKLNQMEPGQVPANGAKLHLRKKRDTAPELQFKTVILKEEQSPSAPPHAAPLPDQETVSQAQASAPSGQAASQEVEREKPEKASAPQQKTSDRDVRTHRVEPGETLFAISRQEGVAVDQIMKWNDLQDAQLRVGQVLRLEAPSSVAADGSPSERHADAESDYIVHQVAPGDTLYSIAREYNVGVNNISKANQMDSLEISPGQELKIPQYER